MTAPTRPRSVPPIRPAGTAPAVQWRQARRDGRNVTRHASARRALARITRRAAT